MPEIMEPFHLLNSDSNISETDGSANSWEDIWKYQVPRGTELVLSPGDPLSVYLEDTSPAEVGNHSAKVEVVMRDPAERENTLIAGPAAYIAVKEFQDDDLIFRLKLLEPLRVPSRYWLVIRAYDDATIDASDSAFDLFIHRARAGVTA